MANWGSTAQCRARAALTLLDDLLGLFPDAGVAQEAPLPLLADLALQVVLLRDLPGQEHTQTGPVTPRSAGVGRVMPQCPWLLSPVHAAGLISVQHRFLSLLSSAEKHHVATPRSKREHSPGTASSEHTEIFLFLLIKGCWPSRAWLHSQIPGMVRFPPPFTRNSLVLVPWSENDAPVSPGFDYTKYSP